MLADWQSANAIYGRTNNPWDLGYTPGGSSGGSAAAIAAGLSALEVGSDIGGSIRVSAAFCGVYGHRPSETLLSRSGQFPLPPMPNSAVVMGVQGPIARSAEDLELALSVLAGPEVGEDVAWRVELPAARRERLAEFRVGVLPPIPWIALDDRIAAALEDVAARLARLGCAVERVQPEGIGDWKEHYLLPRLPVRRDRRGPAGDRVSRRTLARGLADRPAGDRPVSRGPDADPVRGAAGEGDRRVHEAGRLRRVIGRRGRSAAGEPGAAA
jgi:Asp-tRNA(Asn)/Glu-tRNA(Gln) amidotransferase A subunit family amidase